MDLLGEGSPGTPPIVFTNNKTQKWVIRGILFLMIIVWTIILFIIKPEKDWIRCILLLIPYIVFIIGIVSTSDDTEDVSQELMKGNFLSFAFIVSIILVNTREKEPLIRNKYLKLLFIGFFLLMLSIIDVWVNKDYIRYILYAKSSFQTMAIVILTLILYDYYVNQLNESSRIIHTLRKKGDPESVDLADRIEEEQLESL